MSLKAQLEPLRAAFPLLLVALSIACGGVPDDAPSSAVAAGRVIFIAVDGAEFQLIESLAAEGRLPAFRTMIEEGARAELRSLPGLDSPALWTTIATGFLPVDHGIPGFTRKDPETGRERLVTSNLRRRPAVWDLAGELRGRVVVVGWLASWPAYPLNGTLVSSYCPYVLDRPTVEERIAKPLKGTLLLELPGAVHPPQDAKQLGELLVRPQELTKERLRPFADLGPAEDVELGDDPWLRSLRFTHAADLGFVQVAERLYAREQPVFHSVYLGGIDVLSHRFWRHMDPRHLAASPGERRRFGGTIAAYYEWVDGVVGDYLRKMDDQTTLIVASDHGFRGLESPEPGSANSGGHRPVGVLLMYGHGVARGSAVGEARLIDLAPTMLTLLGLPPARDMPGRVLTRALTASLDEVGEPPETYANVPFRVGEPASVDSPVDDEVLDRLRSLGYVD